jgi:hypothetical protein
MRHFKNFIGSFNEVLSSEQIRCHIEYNNKFVQKR